MVTLGLPSLCYSSSASVCHSPRQHPYCLSTPFSLKTFHDRGKRLLTVFAVNNEEENNEAVPSWANPASDEPPPWARNEDARTPDGFRVPFYVYLLASAITAIAAIGSVFEYINQKPVFGVLESDSIFYAPVLGFFAFTGIPTSGFLWFKSVQVANKEAEVQDRRDGFL